VAVIVVPRVAATAIAAIATNLRCSTLSKQRVPGERRPALFLFLSLLLTLPGTFPPTHLSYPEIHTL
jgi:hypothetical protein